MAELSNQLMAIAVLAYLAAMVCYAAEYAFGNRSHIGRAATRQLVGAGAPVEEPTPVVAEERPPKDRGALLGLIGIGLNVLAVLLHFGTLVTRGVAADRMPWGNMYEFTLSVTFVGAVAWLGVLARRPGLRHLGLFVALSLVVLLGANGL